MSDCKSCRRGNHRGRQKRRDATSLNRDGGAMKRTNGESDVAGPMQQWYFVDQIAPVRVNGDPSNSSSTKNEWS